MAPTVTTPLYEPPRIVDQPPVDPLDGLPAAIGSVCLAHDYLLVMRGAERTFAAISEAYCDAPIYTLLYDERGTGSRFAGRTIETSPLQRLGLGQADFRRYLPLYTHMAKRLRPPSCDVVLSSSSAFAHGLTVPAGAVHVCYCYTPFRYAWNERGTALREAPAPLRPLLALELSRIRRWDRAASARVDAYVAISQLGRERIKRCYGREAAVVHPPVETHRFAPGRPGERLLVVSELVRHKRVHIALEAARRARAPIAVVGNGPDAAVLRDAYPEAEFLGRASDSELAELYAGARAVIAPGPEEFGIVAVEAQAAGRPVIAAGVGGALETVIAGETGLLARLDDADSFAAAMRAIDRLDLDPAHAVRNAERFSVARFQRRIAAQVERALERV
ncbi:MAG TPA: glycosyltransferase [Solirubrobacteraceae bacterium]|jgi:glycosyltransferase involved in cell wall biosynthesis|nr:glycosyltransferase [Solirubrobacteraceae bacterium]